MPHFSLKSHAYLTSNFLRFLDFIIIFSLGFFIYFLRFNFFKFYPSRFLLSDQINYLSNYTALILAAGVLSFLIFNLSGVYQHLRGRSFWHLFKRLFLPWVILVLILGLFAFLTKTGAEYSRIWMMSWLLADFIVLYFYRVCLILIFRFLRSKGFNIRHIVIIGSGELAERAIRSIENNPSMGYVISKVLGPVSLNSQELLAGKLVEPLPQDLSSYLENLKIDEVWLALPLRKESLIKELMHQLRFSTINIQLVPDIFGLSLLNHAVSEIGGLPVIQLRGTPMRGMNAVLKYCEDKFLSALILILISPLLLIVAVGVKLSSKGPVFYQQERISWNNKSFKMLKFRSMPVNTESQTGAVWAKAGENRATKFGSFLRKTSLDELPQFINVLKGDMSIVGPRPERPVFVEQFKDQIPGYMFKHMMKAGITGWAQVNGWRGDTDLAKRIEYDLFYIENWSLSFDIKIIFMTLYKGFVNKNAY